jgi:hypothetical protein
MQKLFKWIKKKPSLDRVLSSPFERKKKELCEAFQLGGVVELKLCTGVSLLTVEHKGVRYHIAWNRFRTVKALTSGGHEISGWKELSSQVLPIVLTRIQKLREV